MTYINVNPINVRGLNSIRTSCVPLNEITIFLHFHTLRASRNELITLCSRDTITKLPSSQNRIREPFRLQRHRALCITANRLTASKRFVQILRKYQTIPRGMQRVSPRASDVTGSISIVTCQLSRPVNAPELPRRGTYRKVVTHASRNRVPFSIWAGVYIRERDFCQANAINTIGEISKCIRDRTGRSVIHRVEKCNGFIIHE